MERLYRIAPFHREQLRPGATGRLIACPHSPWCIYHHLVCTAGLTNPNA